MSFKELYFSTTGRVTRKQYYMNYVLPYAGFIFVAAILDSILFGSPSVFYALVVLAWLWPIIAINVKRLHDRGRSGWMFLLTMVPLVNIWIAIEILFLRGTIGDNDYGKDSLQAVTEEA